jgi:thiol:disulfide interchange protein DsbC
VNFLHAPQIIKCVVGTYLFVLANITPAQNLAAEQNLVKKIEPLLGKKIDSVRQAEFDNIYEAVSDGKIIYIDKTLTHVFSGHIVDVKTKRDLTGERLSKLNQIDFRKLPFFAALKTINGDGRRRIAVFADPNCPFCQRLEKTLALVDDVTISIFMYPVLSEDSQRLSRDVWCAQDKENVWHEWMIAKKRPEELNCESPNEALLLAGKTYHVNATPVIFFEDGTRMVGAASLEKITAKLASLSVTPQRN